MSLSSPPCWNYQTDTHQRRKNLCTAPISRPPHPNIERRSMIKQPDPTEQVIPTRMLFHQSYWTHPKKSHPIRSAFHHARKISSYPVYSFWKSCRCAFGFIAALLKPNERRSRWHTSNIGRTLGALQRLPVIEIASFSSPWNLLVTLQSGFDDTDINLLS